MSPVSPFIAPERDSSFKRGRPKNSDGTVYYCIPGCNAATSSSSALAANLDTYAPWFTDTPIVIDQLAFEVSTLDSGKNIRVGFYAADADWQPVGAPLADSGDISTTTTGMKTYTPGTPIYVPRGRYLSVYNSDTSVAATRVMKCGGPMVFIDTTIGTTPYIGEVTNSRAYGAFPTPGGTWETMGFKSTTPWEHVVVYRISQP